jgi:3-oxoacyl-[acyl-carrier-protein] synthase-1
MELVVTAANCITSVGYTSKATFSAVQAGISGFKLSDEYSDDDGNEIIVAEIAGLSDNTDIDTRIAEIANLCMAELLEMWHLDQRNPPSNVYLLIGIATLYRPGPKNTALLEDVLIRQLDELGFKNVNLIFVPGGNVAIHQALVKANTLLIEDPDALCIIGGIDTLLGEDTLDWLEEEQRLKSETFCRHQGIIPGEAVAFFMIESVSRVFEEDRLALASVTGLGITEEHASRISHDPSRGIAITKACRDALSLADCQAPNIAAVICDLDGEFFRAKQWSYAEIRCFGNSNEERKLWHPADCIGTIGAASSAVFICLLTEAKGWLSGNILMVCIDDEGKYGAAVIAI